MCTGRTANIFYYIMDYNGQYYRTDAKNQLVVAEGEDEAAVFSFADANERVGGGLKSKFYCIVPMKEDIEENAETTNSPAKELTEAEVKEEVEKSISEYDLSKMDWKEYLTHFSYIASGIKDYREELLKAESDVDKKICDVLHYIELCDTDEAEAEDLIELLRVCRENRRRIKDEILVTETFQRNLGTSANVAKAKETIKAINGLETRKYTPRKFAELFEGSEIQTGQSRIKKKKMQSMELQTENAVLVYEEEEECMELVRKETPFDGRENDWMAFAMQQAEFYKHANQYIMNIRLDIEELEDAIADLMEEIEQSNCNVAQGYKLFKRLKDLRLVQKEKDKELECLYILTEHFDMQAMKEECESNVDALEEFLYGKVGADTYVQAELVEEESQIGVAV